MSNLITPELNNGNQLIEQKETATSASGSGDIVKRERCLTRIVALIKRRRDMSEELKYFDQSLGEVYRNLDNAFLAAIAEEAKYLISLK